MDVGDGGLDLRHADAKRARSFLPGEAAVDGKRVVDPFGRAAFDQLNRFGRLQRAAAIVECGRGPQTPPTAKAVMAFLRAMPAEVCREALCEMD